MTIWRYGDWWCHNGDGGADSDYDCHGEDDDVVYRCHDDDDDDAVDYKGQVDDHHLMQLEGGAWRKMVDNNIENILQIIPLLNIVVAHFYRVLFCFPLKSSNS